ncbi:TIGR01777 family oxidoreductase [Sphingobacterium sp. SYP-B4668]|uniref:TIGR01777 family oxidoreductase n=1 Tax=Sphingobacterium sp. SYP-B4668 TaxID=2996035 RepID=UPI0022DDB1D4|nr:TIGR01777 family oxidoreductase [Sphingobacterium sp. SYP-B4668]
MKEIILITGANGFIANNLSKILKAQYELRYLTRHVKRDGEFKWDIASGEVDRNAFANVNHIIHLSGASIFDKRWTDKQKQLLRSSRIDASQLLLDTLQSLGQRIKTFISGSAMGYYGMTTSKHIFHEQDPPGDDFLANLTKDWEAKADLFNSTKVADRVVKIRTSIVLAHDGGSLPLLIKLSKYYANPVLGSGQQYFPWIHIDDLIHIFEYALRQPSVIGAVNAAASEHITNRQFTHRLAKHLHKKVVLPAVPAPVIKLALGQQADMILNGSRISNSKIMQLGYRFKFPVLDDALHDILS